MMTSVFTNPLLSSPFHTWDKTQDTAPITYTSYSSSYTDENSVDSLDDEDEADATVVTGRELIYEVSLFRYHYLLRKFHHGLFEGERWLMIGGLNEKPPAGAAAIRFSQSSQPMVPTFDGFLHSPAWYSPTLPHRPYIPNAASYIQKQSDSTPPLSWLFLEFGAQTAENFIHSTDPSKLDPYLLEIIDNDIRMLCTALDWFGDSAQVPRRQVPLSYDKQRLRDTCNQEAVIREVNTFQAQALQLLAALSYNISFLDTASYDTLECLYRPCFRAWLLSEQRVGALIDPNDHQFPQYPLLKLLQDRCTLFLPWDFKYRPTIDIEEQITLSQMSGQEFAYRIDRAFSSHNTESGASISATSPSSFTLDTASAKHSAEQLQSLALRSDCVLGAAEATIKIPFDFGSLSVDPCIIEYGYLTTDIKTEARLRQYAFLRLGRERLPPGGCAGAALIIEALRKGMRFVLAYPQIASRAFKLEKQWSAVEPSVFDNVIGSVFIPRNLPAKDSLKVYTTNVAHILTRPEAAGWLTRGGLLERIILHFGPTDIVQRFFDGPTSLAYQLRKSVAPGLTLFSDVPHPSVISILLGTVEGDDRSDYSTWFPPLNVWEQQVSTSGYWTKWDEEWFQGYLASLTQTPLLVKPLTRSEWADFFHAQIQQSFAMRSRLVPLAVDITDLCASYVRQCGDTWCPRKLSEAKITPVQVDDVIFNVSA